LALGDSFDSWNSSLPDGDLFHYCGDGERVRTLMRAKETYRGYRRNQCIRVEHGVWGPDWYYTRHRKEAHKTIPAERVKRKLATTSGGVHEFLRRRDYAGAVKHFFKRGGGERRTKATGLGRGD
jgi:hypothetical protein